MREGAQKCVFPTTLDPTTEKVAVVEKHPEAKFGERQVFFQKNNMEKVLAQIYCRSESDDQYHFDILEDQFWGIGLFELTCYDLIHILERRQDNLETDIMAVQTLFLRRTTSYW